MDFTGSNIAFRDHVMTANDMMMQMCMRQPSSRG